MRKPIQSQLRTTFLVLGAVLVVPAVAAGVYLWYFKPAAKRLRPTPTEEALFEGVLYRRHVTQTPRPLIWHLVTVDLSKPGVRALVTPPDLQDGGAAASSSGVAVVTRTEQKEVKVRYPLAARTTSEFLRTFHCQVAINGDDFEQKSTNSPTDFFPHAGDMVNVTGNAISDGVRYARKEGGVSLWISQEGKATISSVAPAEAWNALGGRRLPLPSLVKPRPVQPGETPEAATAVGVDATGTKLYLLVVDGGQPRYSEGMTAAEVGAILFGVGATDAIRLDGGGSSTLVAEREGRVEVLNSPIDQKQPGRERVVANHLGIFAPKTASQKAALRH